jgi:hypothetical protein
MTAIQLRCAAALQALGPKPPWWRVFKRRAWMRKARPIAALVIAEAMQVALQQVATAMGVKAQVQQGQWQGLRVVKDEEVN